MESKKVDLLEAENDRVITRGPGESVGGRDSYGERLTLDSIEEARAVLLNLGM